MTFVKNLFPTIMVFALTPWIVSVGIANVFITLTVIFTAILLCSVFFLVYGKRFRIKSAARYLKYADIHI